MSHASESLHRHAKQYWLVAILRAVAILTQSITTQCWLTEIHGHAKQYGVTSQTRKAMLSVAAVLTQSNTVSQQYWLTAIPSVATILIQSITTQCCLTEIHRHAKRYWLKAILSVAAILTQSITTGWRRLIVFLKLQVIFRQRATKYRALLRKMTYGDKVSYGSPPPCTQCWLTEIHRNAKQYWVVWQTRKVTLTRRRYATHYRLCQICPPSHE